MARRYENHISVLRGVGWKGGAGCGSREQGLCPQVGGVAAARTCQQSAPHAWQLQTASLVLCPFRPLLWPGQGAARAFWLFLAASERAASVQQGLFSEVA